MKLNLLKIDRLVIMGSILLIFSSLLALIVPLSLRNVIDGGAMQSMFMNSVTVALLFIGQALLASLGNYLFSRSGEAKIAAVRMQVTNHLLYGKKSFFDQSKSGELASRIVNDTSSIREFLITTFPDLITSLVLIIGAVFVLFSLDWQLSLVLLLSLPLMLLFVIPLANIGGKYTRCMQDEVSVLTGNLTEKFREIEMIKTSQEEEKVQNQLLRNIKNTQHISVKGDLIASFESPFALLFIFATVALIFTYGGQRVATGSLTVGTLVSFLIYLFQLLNPVSSLSNFLTAYARMKGAVSSLEELLLVEQENLGDGGQASGDNLVFDNVSFSYDGHHPVLSDINLTIFKGQKVAFVGPSGSGKTTLARLVERFYEPNQGKILLDNQSISVFQLKDWRRRIAWVSQNDAVLSGTIRENLCFGIFSDVSDEQLFFALDQVLLGDDIRKMPCGLDTEVGENGRLLSGGQRQRLQIARAYLRNSDFLIFDEATANLDADSEYAVTQSLNGLLKKKTSIIIAHRLSTIVDADCIYFLENHQITGSGTHQELLATHKTYARFVQEQMI